MAPELGGRGGDRGTLPFCHEWGRQKRSGHVGTGKLHSFSARIFLDGSKNSEMPQKMAVGHGSKCRANIEMSADISDFSDIWMRSKFWFEIGISDQVSPSEFIILHWFTVPIFYSGSRILDTGPGIPYQDSLPGSPTRIQVLVSLFQELGTRPRS